MATTGNGPSFLAINQGYIYVSHETDNTIGRISLANPSNKNLSWATTDGTPEGIAIHDGYIYVTQENTDTIGRISLADPSNKNLSWVTTGVDPDSLFISNGYLYVVTEGTSSIDRISINDPVGDNTTNWYSTGLELPEGCTVYGSNLYITENNNNTIYIYDFSSEICFPSNTPITTDQGVVMIQNIDPQYNTINSKPIQCITKTISNSKYLVCFEKHALGLNCPNQKTIMSTGHHVFHKGKKIVAKKFLQTNNKRVHKEKYNGEILYNILMEDYSTVIVNNMVCETLDPSNKIAQLYISKLNKLSL